MPGTGVPAEACTAVLLLQLQIPYSKVVLWIPNAYNVHHVCASPDLKPHGAQCIKSTLHNAV